MMQNNPMGAMMPQGVAPAASTGLNFQSDPSMRAQFKGFMSGMQAKQPAPAAPMAPMMQQPLPMPPSMQNIDIFQPSMPMRMAMGGSVPRNAQIAGQPHMLSYITPSEAGVLRAMGGAGRPGPGGIPSFFFSEGMGVDDGGSSFGGSDNFSSSYDVATQSDDNSPSYNDPYESSGTAGTVNFTSGGVDDSPEFGGSDDGNRYDSSGNTVNFSTTTTPGAGAGMDSPEVYAMDALSNLMAREAARIDAQNITARGGTPEIVERFDPASQVIGMSQQPMEAEFANLGGAGVGAASNVQAISNIADVLGENARAQNNLLDTVFDSDDYMSTPDTVFDVDTTFTGPIGVPPEVQSVRDLEGQAMGPFDLANRTTPEGLTQNVVSGPTSRPEGLGPSRDSTIGTGMNEGQDSGPPLLSFDLGGMGDEGEAVPPPGLSLEEVQSAMDLARATGDSVITKQSEIGRLADLMDRRTTVTGGDKKNIPGRVDPNTGLPINVDAKSVSSLEQLGRRAGRGSEGVSGFIERLTGFNPAASMYEDIVNNNYSPIYDNRGQIIGTINPETGQLGKGSRSIDTSAISSTDSDLPAFKYNQFADRNLAGGGGDNAQPSSPPPVFTPPDPVDDSGEKAPPMINRPDTGGGTQQPVVKLPPAQVGNPLQFGYGQFNLSPNLNSAADSFLRLLGGR